MLDKAFLLPLRGLLLTLCALLYPGQEALGNQEAPAGQQLLTALPPETPKLLKQRQQFVRGRQALAAGDRSALYRLKKDLADYPLLAYLDYADLSVRLSRLGNKEIEAFLNKYRDSTFASHLLQRWLKNLAIKKAMGK